MPYHHGDLPRAIIAAARRRLRVEPGQGLSIRELAREVGVSPNAPYRHFADRDALLRAIAAEGYRVAALRLATDGRGADGAAETWRLMATEEPALVELMTSLPPGSATDDGLQAAIGEWLGELIRAVEGDVRSDDPGEAIRLAIACWAAFHGLSSLRRSGALAMIDGWLLPEAGELASRLVRE